MIDRRLVLGMIAAATTIDASRIAFAKEKHHHNGKDLLGEKIKKNGKHKIHSTGKKVDVFAEVNNGKVTAVTAAGMQVKKVRSRQKLAETTPGITLKADLGCVRGPQPARAARPTVCRTRSSDASSPSRE